MPKERHIKYNGRKQFTMLSDPDFVAEFVPRQAMDYRAYCELEATRLRGKGLDAVVENILNECAVYVAGI